MYSKKKLTHSLIYESVVGLFISLLGVFRPTQDFFSHLETCFVGKKKYNLRDILDIK